MTQLPLNESTFSTIKDMLESSDPVVRDAGYEVVETCNQADSIVFTLCLKKVLPGYLIEEWKTKAPKTCAFLTSLGVNIDRVTSYKHMLDILCKVKVSQAHMEFFLSIFTSYMEKAIRDMGHETILFGKKLKVSIQDIKEQIYDTK